MELSIHIIGNHDFGGKYSINEDGVVKEVCSGRIIPHCIVGTKEKNNIYKAISMQDVTYKWRVVKIHRMLGILFIPNPLNLPLVDHVDTDNFNNSLSNLRWNTHVGNCQNRSSAVGSTSKFIGVSMQRGKWRATAGIARKNHHIGTFEHPAHAAYARDRFVKIHQQTPKLNFKTYEEYVTECETECTVPIF